jgi:hypothetical protein
MIVYMETKIKRFFRKRNGRIDSKRCNYTISGFRLRIYATDMRDFTLGTSICLTNGSCLLITGEKKTAVSTGKISVKVDIPGFFLG